MPSVLPIRFFGIRVSGPLTGHDRRVHYLNTLVESGQITPSLLRSYVEYQVNKQDLVALEVNQQFLVEELKTLVLRKQLLADRKERVGNHVQDLIDILVENLKLDVM